jgi:hypothetical protein
MLRAALAVAVLLGCVSMAQGQERLPPVNGVSSAGYSPDLLPPAGETKFFSDYTDPQKPPEAVARGWSEASGEDFDDFGTWWDNTLVSFGGEAFRSIGDASLAGASNSAGAVSTLNSAFELIEGSEIGGQVGVSYGVFDFKGRSYPLGDTKIVEQQLFVTAGVFKRSNILFEDQLSWGLVWDHLQVWQWGNLGSDGGLDQVRGIMGWALSARNEVGFWGAWRAGSTLSPTYWPRFTSNQYNAFWRHNYDFGGQTMIWIGGADPSSVTSWLVGALGQAPLSNSIAIYGNFTFALPSASAGISGSWQEEWAVGAGLTYYFGAKSVSPTVSGRQGLPLIPVANNGTMLITY